MYIPSEQVKHVLLSTGYLNKKKYVNSTTNNYQTDMKGPVVSSQQVAKAMQLLLSRLIIVDVLALRRELKRFSSRLNVTGNDLFKHLAKCDVKDADQRCHGTGRAPANSTPKYSSLQGINLKVSYGTIAHL